MKKIIALLIASLLIGILVFKVFSLYHGQFSDRFSDDPAIWGQYGDYIGGLLNPLFSLVNIGVLIYLTYLVWKKDDNRSANELRYRALKDFTDKFYVHDVFDSTFKGALVKHVDKPAELISYLSKFRSHNIDFFKNKLQEDKFDVLSKELIDAFSILKSIRDSIFKNIENDPKVFTPLKEKDLINRTIQNWNEYKDKIIPLEGKLIKLMFDIVNERNLDKK